MRVLVVLLLFMILSFSVVAQNESSNETAATPSEATPPPSMTPPPATLPSSAMGSSLDAHKHALRLAAARQLIRMDAALAVATDKSLDTSELVRIRGAFDAQRASIDTAAGDSQLLAVEDLLENLAKDFLNTAKEIGLRAYGDSVKARITALEVERANESDYYTEQAIESRKIAMLRFFDQHVELAQDAIEKSLSRNVSMNATQTALTNFISLKPALVSAINSRDKKQVQDINKRIKDGWKAIRDSFTEAHLGDKIQRSIDRGESIASKADTNMRKLRTGGISVGALEKRLAAFRAELAKARQAADSSNYVEAQDALRSAKAELALLKTTYDQTRTGTLKQAAGATA